MLKAKEEEENDRSGQFSDFEASLDVTKVRRDAITEGHVDYTQLFSFDGIIH